MSKSKNSVALVILLLAGIVIGGFLGTLAESSTVFSWLNYGQTFGLDSPIVLNLGILVITFALSLRITIASIIGVVIGLVVYRLL